MFWFSKDDKAIIDVSMENQRFKRGRTVTNPILFMVTEENISERRTKGVAHGHTIRLLVEVTVKKENSVFSRKFEEVGKLGFIKAKDRAGGVII